jgi:hypothetical protein
MIPSQMKRDDAKVQSALIETGDTISTKSDMWVYAPVKYSSKGLAYVSSSVSVVGVLLFTTDNVSYAVSCATTMLDLNPTKIETVVVDEEEFYRFFFPKGSVVISDRKPKKILGKVNDCFDYFYGYGHSPWWMSRVDLAMLLSRTKYFNSLKIHNSQITLDVLASQICRSPDDLKVFARHSDKSLAGCKVPATTVPLRNGALNRSSNLALLGNSELKRGLRAAMLNEPVREEPLESLFMK